ncbi:MAG TPA: adenylate kinase [Actinomycetota bacterium]|nr:adenylate kinase [Actinomycetota bacterium]
MRVVLLGPPGAGKGTQAHRLADRFGLALISTGDIFRANLRDRTALGMEAKGYMDAGDLVPDDVVVRMVLARLSEPDAEPGFVLDGFPRTLGQAWSLEDALAEAGGPLDAVLKFTIPDDVAVHRLLGRFTCPSCQRTYNVESNPPRTAGVCDVCGGRLMHRDDDAEATVRHRIEVYHRDTEPLERLYDERGLLHPVEAVGDVDDVTERAVEAMKAGAAPA